MAENSGEVVDPSIIRNARVKTILTWFGAVICILYVLSILATRFLPHPIGTTLSSILLDIAVVLFIGALPVFEVILWRLREQLPHNGYWGLLFLLVGIALLLLVGAIVIFCSTFLPTLSYPPPLLITVSVVTGIGFALVVLGLLIVFAQLVWEFIQLFRAGRRARIGGRL